MNTPASPPLLYGLFHRNIEGDEALLRLAQRRYERAGIGAEFYPGTPEEADWEWQFAPRNVAHHMVHLPRYLDVLDPSHRSQILQFAEKLAGRARGLVVHDSVSWIQARTDLHRAVQELNARLRQVQNSPTLHLEYAAGIPLESFAEMAQMLGDLPFVSVCLDTGHVATFATKARFCARQPEPDFWALVEDPLRARSSLPLLRDAMSLAVEDLVGFVAQVAAVDGPLHFHLHDSHPLSRLSHYGVKDHLSFSEEIPVPSDVDPSGRQLPTIGRQGLERVLAAVAPLKSATDISFTLEIHHTRRGIRTPLGEDMDLFRNWQDLSNAELTLAWLNQIAQNAELVRGLWPRLDGPHGSPAR
jgi:hypothetical protein